MVWKNSQRSPGSSSIIQGCQRAQAGHRKWGQNKRLYGELIYDFHIMSIRLLTSPSGRDISNVAPSLGSFRCA